MSRIIVTSIALVLLVVACSTSSTGASADASKCTVAGVEYDTAPLSESPVSSPKAFPCPDGCNTCTCLADGSMNQTTMGCGSCVRAKEPPAGTACERRTVVAQGPDGRCCQYASPCNLPDGLQEVAGAEKCESFYPDAGADADSGQ